MSSPRPSGQTQTPFSPTQPDGRRKGSGEHIRKAPRIVPRVLRKHKTALISKHANSTKQAWSPSSSSIQGTRKAEPTPITPPRTLKPRTKSKDRSPRTYRRPRNLTPSRTLSTSSTETPTPRPTQTTTSPAQTDPPTPAPMSQPETQPNPPIPTAHSPTVSPFMGLSRFLTLPLILTLQQNPTIGAHLDAFRAEIQTHPSTWGDVIEEWENRRRAHTDWETRREATERVNREMKEEWNLWTLVGEKHVGPEELIEQRRRELGMKAT